LVSQDSPKLLSKTLHSCVSHPHESSQKTLTPFHKSPLFWLTMIHILKLWTSPKDPQPLVSNTLKVPSFGFHDSHLECLNSVSDLSKIAPRLRKSRHGWCVRPKVRQPYPEIASRCTKLRHNFCFSKAIHSASKIASRLPKSRHDFEFS